MGKHIEMRQHPRQEVFNAVMLTRKKDRHSAMALDLSEGGARVGLLDQWQPPVGAALRMFFLFYTAETIVLQCKVTRVAADHLGVAFEPAQGKRIQRLLDAVGKLH